MPYTATEFKTLKTKKARTEYIRNAVHADYGWAIRGLKRIYEHQTADEQASGTTRNHNDVGFSGADAYILSSFAEQVLKGRILSTKQRAILHKKMRKYAKQLERLAAPYEEAAA